MSQRGLGPISRSSSHLASYFEAREYEPLTTARPSASSKSLAISRSTSFLPQLYDVDDTPTIVNCRHTLGLRECLGYFRIRVGDAHGVQGDCFDRSHAILSFQALAQNAEIGFLKGWFTLENALHGVGAHDLQDALT